MANTHTKFGWMMNPSYPVYIVSKGRWDKCITSKQLNLMGVPHRIVVPEDEVSIYSSFLDHEIIPLPQKYIEDYDTCDSLGDSKSKGPGSARNFCWDHSLSLGAKRHWVMDDNIEAFYRANRNLQLRVRTGSILRAAEDFVDRYENVPVAGLNYEKFFNKTQKVAPYVTNTRIYSCLLIENSSPYRWRGRYNEDTDLSLRVLKDGLCTIQFNAFLQGKVTTQRMRGGNSEVFYDDEGTKPKSEMIEELHPDVAKVVWKYNRWHHHVDYKPFRTNKLIKKQGLIIPKGVNEYGMKLVSINENKDQ